MAASNSRIRSSGAHHHWGIIGHRPPDCTRAAAASIVGGAAAVPPRNNAALSLWLDILSTGRQLVFFSFFFSPLPAAPPFGAVSCGVLPCPIDRVCRH